MNLMSIRAIITGKYALSLMDALFSDEEMGAKCFSGTSRSNKEALHKEKVKLIEGLLNTKLGIKYAMIILFSFFLDCIDKKFGCGTFVQNSSNIYRRCKIMRFTTGNPQTHCTSGQGICIKITDPKFFFRLFRKSCAKESTLPSDLVIFSRISPELAAADLKILNWGLLFFSTEIKKMAARRSLRLSEGQKTKQQFSTSPASQMTEKPPDWQLDVSPITDAESDDTTSQGSGRRIQEEVISIPDTFPENADALEDISGLTQAFGEGEELL